MFQARRRRCSSRRRWWPACGLALSQWIWRRNRAATSPPPCRTKSSPRTMQALCSFGLRSCQPVDVVLDSQLQQLCAALRAICDMPMCRASPASGTQICLRGFRRNRPPCASPQPGCLLHLHCVIFAVRPCCPPRAPRTCSVTPTS